MATDSVKFSIQAVDKTAAAFASVKNHLNSLSATTLKVGAAIAGLVGIGGLGIMAKGAMDTADKIHKLNIRIGASTEALSQYRHVANLSGVSFEQFTDGLEKMSRNIGEAMQDAGTAKDALKELGLSVDWLYRLSPEDQFEQIADAIAKIENPTDKTRLAMDIFGRSGGVLVQIMAAGADGITKMRQEADALGMTMTKSMVTNVADANDAIAKLSERVAALVEKLMGSLSPIITSIANDIGAWIDQNQELIKQNLPWIIDDLIDKAQDLAPLFELIYKVMQQTAIAVGHVTTSISNLINWMQQYQAVATSLDWISDFLSAGGALKMVNPALAGISQASQSTQFSPSSTPNQGGGTKTVVNNFNTQLTRNDAVAIAAESSRYDNRQ